ncbi:PIG-L deacetylase family protein [Jatrophihabitans sp. DSM 45814]
MTGVDVTRPPMPIAERRIVGRGTPERDWQNWAGWADLDSGSLVDLVPPGQRLVVVAPHPDDEVLGAGGLLLLAAAAGRSILVVAVTDGSGSHPGSDRYSPAELVTQRRSERQNALQLLGIAAASVVEFGLEDGTVTSRTQHLTALIDDITGDGDVIVTPWRYDGHPDHEATAIAVSAVIARSTATIRQLEAPIWGWHWASPSGGQLPARSGFVLPLEPDVCARKLAAIRCFTSQLEPDLRTQTPAVLPDYVLQRFTRSCEVFLR